MNRARPGLLIQLDLIWKLREQGLRAGIASKQAEHEQAASESAFSRRVRASVAKELDDRFAEHQALAERGDRAVLLERDWCFQAELKLRLDTCAVLARELERQELAVCFELTTQRAAFLRLAIKRKYVQKSQLD